MIKKKINKLTLRRETLTVLDLQAVQGGVAISGVSVVVRTVHSVCEICIPYPVIPPQEWPQTAG